MEWPYINLPVKKDGDVLHYLSWVRDTHMLKSWEDTIGYLIASLDPDWDLPQKEES